MGLNDTPSGERTHISFFGRRNAGKSSLVNAVTGQELSVVSETLGTTTDPVSKAMEILPLGPVVVTDTPGFDDSGALGDQRVERARRVLARTDIAVLVVDSTKGLCDTDRELIELFMSKGIQYITVYSKSDLNSDLKTGEREICVSAVTGDGINELKEMLGRLSGKDNSSKLVGDLVDPGDIAVLVTPIDSAAPKGRLILPQQQTIRDILDAGAMAFVTRETELEETLKGLKTKPKMVITDSQAFSLVDKITPKDIKLTSFSILMARYKGFLDTAVEGAAAIKSLKDGDRVLISEGCTHHRQCDDIGTVKLPRWLHEFTGCRIDIDTSSGGGFPADLSKYALVIHCGGCMLNGREITSRSDLAKKQGVPFTNYGIAIALMKGILKRSIEIFPHLCEKI